LSVGGGVLRRVFLLQFILLINGFSLIKIIILEINYLGSEAQKEGIINLYETKLF
jgi:hypothetical protein